MFVRPISLVYVSAASILLGVVPIGQSAAQEHECSGKYQDAKAAGTLNGDTWPQFYSKCAADAKANPPASAAAAAAAPLDVRHICGGKYQDAKAADTLKGETWPQFYSRCVAETTASPPAAEATAAPAAAPPAPAAVATPAPAPAPVAATPEPAPAPVAAAPEAPPVAAPVTPPAITPPPVNPNKQPAPEPRGQAMAAAPSTAVFPSAISSAHAGEKPDIARRKTCLDQFKANKATNANGGLKWIQKVGGYWKECDKHLKG
jgi:hypothetical protein